MTLIFNRKKRTTTLLCLILSISLFGQEQIQLLAKFDPGLPASGLNGSNLGEVISYIGDINNDGFDDWAVGLPYAANYETGEQVGKVYIYLGSNSIIENDKPNSIIEGELGDHSFGSQISYAGDVNNDGHSDIIIGNHRKMKLYFGGNPIDTVADAIFSGHSNFNTAGDVNYDGFDDIIATDGRQVKIYFGGEEMNSTADIVLQGENKYDFFGRSVSSAGDFNNDGYDDVIIGASGYDLNGYDVGKTYLYFGGNLMDTIPDLTMTGEHPDDHFGSTVADAGDFNGDGVDDILVSAYHYQHEDKESGRTYIYYGGTKNDTIADIIIDATDGYPVGDINNDGYSDILVGTSVYLGGQNADNIPDYDFIDINRIAGLGDYDNDGYTDIIRGISWRNDIDYSGKFSIYFGGSSFDITPDITFYGAPEGDYFGESLSFAGDLNNDGYNDFIIGAPWADMDYENSGAAYVYFGNEIINNKPNLILPGEIKNAHWGESVSSAGDVNNDGYDDIIVAGSNTMLPKIYFGGPNMDSIPDLTFNRFGSAVSYAGDFNKDGYNDLLIGNPGFDKTGTNSGRIYLYFGGSLMDTIPDIIIDGETQFDIFGSAVASAGDVNDDGFDDIMIVAPGFDDANNRLSGRFYLFYGNAEKDTVADVVITGSLNYGRIVLINSAGDLNNDGYDDFMIGSPFYGSSPYGISHLHIYFGGDTIDSIPDLSINKMIYGFAAGISNAGDFNNDGYDDIIVGGSSSIYFYNGGESMDTIESIKITRDDIFSEFGTSLSYPGDINNDGYPDFLVGDRMSSAVGTNMGRAYIYTTAVNTGVENSNERESLVNIYPNPFNTNTTIEFNITKPEKVIIKIFNSVGQEIETLTNNFHATGTHKIEWQPGNLPSGIYFCHFQTSTISETKKILFQK